MNSYNDEFLQQFENHTLDVERFDHLGHIRIAWIYLTKYPLDDAIEKVNKGIASYAKSKGANDKFQLTLTEAIVRILATRLLPNVDHSFKNFLSENQDLITDLPLILEKHYSKEMLYSERAKKVFIAPDIQPIPLPLRDRQ